MKPEQYAVEIYDFAAELIDAIERKDLEHAGISIDIIMETCEKLSAILEAGSA